MKIIVDWDSCDSNGNCVIAAPDILKLNETDELLILKETFGEQYREQAEQAVKQCPKCALSISNQD